MFDLGALARLDDGLARLTGVPAPRRDDVPADLGRRPDRASASDGPAAAGDAEPRCPFLHGAAA